MSTRNRMTWGGKSAAGVILPIETASKKKGSAHPQTPDEGITHPAGYPDPTQPADYENGDTSSWAEDVHGGPYRTSPAPANPMDDGGYRHPAAQPGAPAKNASEFYAHAKRKASKCVRIASALLGPEITKAADADDRIAIDMLEAQALDFMELDDQVVSDTLRRLEAATEDADTLLRKMLAGEDAEEDVEDEDSEEEEAATDKKAEDMRMAEVMSMLANIQAELASLKGGKVAESSDPDDEEAMLAAMLAEEEAPMKAEESDEEAMLAAMLAEEAAPMKAEEPPMMAEEPPAKMSEYYDDTDMGVDLDVDMNMVDDPMGLFDDPMIDDGEDAMLASLFASDETSSDEDEEEEEAPKTAAARTAAARTAATKLRPQPKKPSVGVKSVGQQRRVAGDSMTELANLWASAPDVTDVFNG